MRGATETAARNVVAETNFRNDADFVVDNATPDAEFWTQYNATSTSYVAADTVAYAAYLSAVDSAAQAYADEQCRVTGLFYDAVDTGISNIADGAGSLDVQVCFRVGTKVRMADGTHKVIEQIQVGDLVKMVGQHNPDGEIVGGKVVRVFHNDPQPLWILKFGDLELGVTKEHPFYVKGKGWIPAGDLEIGDLCRTAADGEIALTSKELDAAPVPVFNFEVEGGHTYFVGDGEEQSVLVHNICDIHHIVTDFTCDACLRNMDQQSIFVDLKVPSQVKVNNSVNQGTNFSFELPEWARKQIEKLGAKYGGDGHPSGGTGGLNRITVGSFGNGQLGVGTVVRFDNATEMGKYLMRHPTKLSGLNPMISVYAGAEYTYVFTDNISVSAGGRIGVRGVDDRGNVGGIDFNMGSEFRYENKNIQLFFGPNAGRNGYGVQSGFRF